MLLKDKPEKLIHCDDIRNWIEIKNGRVVTPPEEWIDIFSVTSKKIPHWQPKVKLPAYESLSKVYLDIETDLIPEDEHGKRLSGREAGKVGRVRMIGIRNERKRNKLILRGSEFEMLVELRDILEKKKPDLLITFNGVDFDLPYLYERFEKYGIVRNPFYMGKKQSRFGAAAIAGRPWDIWFTPVYVNVGDRWNKHKIQHIDLYQLAIAYDSVLRKFNKFSLKSLPLEMGLRQEARLEMSPLQMQEAYDNNDYTQMIEYLNFDLEDTELLANALMPSLYYQRTYFPRIELQQMLTSGNATKWLTLLADHYGQRYTDSLVRGVIAKFKGAITRAVAGIHRWVAAFDFSGQYPSCMGQYGIFSENDPDMIMNAAMGHAVNFRGEIKYKEDPTKLEVDLSAAVKPVINSAYGSLASVIPFGDSIAAATVTLMARARIKWAIAFVERLGGKIVLSDTDSLYITTERTDIHKLYPIPDQILAKLPPDAPPELLSAVAIGEQLKRELPGGAALDFDGVMKILFVPPSTTPEDYNKSYKLNSHNGRKFAYKHLVYQGNLESDDPLDHIYLDKDLVDREIYNLGHEKVTFKLLDSIAKRHDMNFPDYIAVRKNYIKLEWNPKKIKYTLKAKGKYVKRDRFELEKEFQQKYIEKLVSSEVEAELYYQTILAQLQSGVYDLEKLKVTRMIRVGEVNLIKLGIGRVHERVSFYIGTDGNPTKTGAYSIPHYVDRLKKMHSELTCFSTEKAKKSQPQLQMSFF